MESSTSVCVVGIKYLLYVQNMERAVKFYCETFGLTRKIVSSHWSEISFGDAVIALHGGGNQESRQTGLSFTVMDIEKACKEVKRSGGAIKWGPEDRGEEGIVLAGLVDSEGNCFMMSQNKNEKSGQA